MRPRCGAGARSACASDVRGTAAAGRDALNRLGLAEFCSVAALDGGVAPRQGRTTSCARDSPASLDPSDHSGPLYGSGLGLCSENLIGTNSQPAFRTIRILPQYRNSATQYTQSSEASFSFHSPMILSYYSRHLDQSLLILNLFDQHQG